MRDQVDFFCYPFGQYTAEAMQSVKACGFAGAVSTKVGAVQQGDDVFALKRLCVPVGATEEEFKARLTWMPQIAGIVHKVGHLDKMARALWGAG